MKWMDLFWNHLQMLWTKSIRKVFQWPPLHTPWKGKLLRSSHYSRTLETQMATHPVFPNSGWFWGGIHRRTTYSPFGKCAQGIPLNLPGLGRLKICRYDLKWHYAVKNRDRIGRLSIKHYIAELLLKLGHPMPKKLQLSPHKWKTVNYAPDLCCNTRSEERRVTT